MQTVLRTLAVLIILTTGTTWARVGENISECTNRYGPATFRHDDEDWSFRTFNFSNRTIKAFYYNSRSMFEMITSGETSFLSEDQAAEIIAHESKFYLGLLGGVYGFTDVELKDALKFNQTRKDTTEASVSHESLNAEFKVVINESKRTIKVIMSVGGGLEFKEAAQDDQVGKSFQKFLMEALTLEDKSKKNKAAEGF